MRGQLEALAAELGLPFGDVDEEFQERAAMREHLGETTRTEAEWLAIDDVRDWFARRSQRMKRETLR